MTTDCVVIGGGIIGMMTAKKLALAGLSVQILDKSKTGQESSWAGGGLLSPIYPWDAHEALWPLVTRGNEVYPKLCEDLLNETGIDPEYQQSGLLNLEPIDIEKMEIWAKKTGSSYEKVDGKQIRAIEKTTNPKFETGVWSPDIAQVRNPRLLKALKQSLLNQKVTITENVEVSGVNEVNGKLVSVRSSQGVIDCKYAVVAAGAWSDKLFQSQSVVEPVRGQMLRIETPQNFLKRIVMRDSVYLIPRLDGNVLIGSSLEYVGFDKSVTPDVAEKLFADAVELVPDLKSFSIAQQWSGLRPGSRDGIPIIEESEAIKGLFINSGHFRNGVGLAPASCERLVSIMFDNSE